MASPLSLDVGYFFGEFQCLPVDDCSAVSCDSGVLARGSESTSFYSTILVQGSFIYYIYSSVYLLLYLLNVDIQTVIFSYILIFF